MISKVLTTFLIISLAYTIGVTSSSTIYLHRDEVNYIYDAFITTRGDLPSFMHAPSGLFTIMNTLILYLYIGLHHFSFTDASIDQIYYDILSDFTDIKLIYVFIIISLLGNIAIKSPQVAISVLAWFAISADMRAIFLSEMPYSLAITLSLYAIRCNHEINMGSRDKNSLIDMLLFGLAVGNRLEFIVILPIFLNHTGLSKDLLHKRILTFLLTFLVFAPWVILYPIGPTKILLGYILAHNSMIFIFCALLILTALVLKYSSYLFFIRSITIFLLLIIVISFVDDRVSIRWALGPSLIVTVAYMLKINNKTYWFEGKKLKSLIAIVILVTLWCHAYLYQGINAWDHRSVNLVEEYRIDEEMKSYITCVTTSTNRLQKLETMGLSGVFWGGLLQNVNLEEKQLNRYVELSKLQDRLNINDIAPRKKLMLDGGNYKGC